MGRQLDRWRGIEVSELAEMDEAQGVTLRGAGDSAGTGGSTTGASGVDGSESVARGRRGAGARARSAGPGTGAGGVGGGVAMAGERSGAGALASSAGLELQGDAIGGRSL